MPLPPIPASHLTGPSDPAKKFRLMERVRVAMAQQRLRPRTIEAYAAWIRRYIEFHGRRHPADLADVEVVEFLSHLAVDKRVAASTQNQALAALKFLYAVVLRQPLGGTMDILPATRPRRLPIVLSAGEVRAVLEQLRDPDRLVVSLLYGSGLRILECVSLRVKDIDLERRLITVRGGKGDKDRCVPLAASAVRDVRRQLRSAYRVWREDGRWGVGVTGIDRAQAVKMPNADREWPWFYLFPAARRFDGPSGEKRRHHLHESKIQRSVRAAGLSAGLGKRVTCHSFRHSFATDLLETGTDIRTIQELMGHSDLKTTMIYTHVSRVGGMGVTSPADRL